MATALVHFEHFPLKEVIEATKPFAMSPIPNTSGSRHQRSLLQRLLGVTWLPKLGVVTTSVAAKTDQAVVTRTWGAYCTRFPADRVNFTDPSLRGQNTTKHETGCMVFSCIFL